MKQIFTSYILLFTLLILCSCGGNKKDKDAWTMPEHEVVTRSMPTLSLTDSLEAGGHKYVYTILRQPSDSLPMVEDDMEDLYLDNTIRLTLKRDGARYFDKTFTKATFVKSIDKTFYQGAILDGIRFMRHEAGQGLVFSFAVSYPDSDMSAPFLMTISDQGTFTFVKNDNLDHEDTDSAFFSDDGV